MAIGFRASTHVASQSTNSLALSAPAGTQSTDVLIASILWDNEFGNTLTPPSGWTVIDTQANTGDLGVWTGWALGSVASLTFSLSGSVTNEGSVCGYTGVDNSTPIAAHSLNLVVGTSPLSTTSITVPANGWFYAAWFDFFGGTNVWSTPAGLTAREVFSAMGAFDSNGVLSGAVTKTSTPGSGSSTRDAAQAVGLAVAAAGGPPAYPPMPQARARRLLAVRRRARQQPLLAEPAGIAAPRRRRLLLPAAHSRVQMVPAPITTAPPPLVWPPAGRRPPARILIARQRLRPGPPADLRIWLPSPRRPARLLWVPRPRIQRIPPVDVSLWLPTRRPSRLLWLTHSRIQMVPAPATTAPAPPPYVTAWRRIPRLLWLTHSRVQMVPAPITVAPIVVIVAPTQRNIRKRHTPIMWYWWAWNRLRDYPAEIEGPFDTLP